jgi:SAM-dependent methyltransferase
MVDGFREIQADAARIRANGLLHAIYGDVYQRLIDAVPATQYPRLLEVGSGGGFLREFAPHAVTSECVPAPGVDRVVDACRIAEAFEPDSLDAVVAFDVFHHLPDAAGFLRGCRTVLRPGGRLVLVEPWYTPVGRYFHMVLHHEPYIDAPDDWRVVGEGRMAAANTRLPTSVFRDSDARWPSEFPGLQIVERRPFHKWLYLLSGGLRFNTRLPASAAHWLVALDRRVETGNDTLGLFARIVVEKGNP